jgi:hypothetical protein
MTDQMQQWARLGAEICLRELDAEAAAIREAFPELKTKNAARSAAMKRALAKRRAQRAK